MIDIFKKLKNEKRKYSFKYFLLQYKLSVLSLNYKIWDCTVIDP